MYVRTLLFLSACSLFAASEQQITLAVRAQSDFDRVELSPTAQIGDTLRCIQSQAAFAAVAVRTELPELYFRQGYCALTGAIATGNAADFREAAAAFDKSIEAWPDSGVSGKGTLIGPLPSGVRIFDSVAKLEGGDPAVIEAAERQISAAVDRPVCPAAVMSASLCESSVEIGHAWLGWMALRQDEFSKASREFAAAKLPAWSDWSAGREAFAHRNYADAAAQYRQAIELWMGARQNPPAFLAARLVPQPEMPRVWTDYGGAQILSGDAAGAIVSLDTAIRGDATLARAIYLRGRANQILGKTDQAIADYSLASRTAFAGAQDLMSGEAHLYRGMAFFLRKDYAHAEDEFSSALNFDIPAPQREDARAWRYMAAVSGGACGASRQALEDSLATASPFFPKQEARKVASTCPLTGGSTAAVTGALVR